MCVSVWLCECMCVFVFGCVGVYACVCLCWGVWYFCLQTWLFLSVLKRDTVTFFNLGVFHNAWHSEGHTDISGSVSVSQCLAQCLDGLNFKSSPLKKILNGRVQDRGYNLNVFFLSTEVVWFQSSEHSHVLLRIAWYFLSTLSGDVEICLTGWDSIRISCSETNSVDNARKRGRRETEKEWTIGSGQGGRKRDRESEWGKWCYFTSSLHHMEHHFCLFSPTKSCFQKMAMPPCWKNNSSKWYRRYRGLAVMWYTVYRASSHCTCQSYLYCMSNPLHRRQIKG